MSVYIELCFLMYNNINTPYKYMDVIIVVYTVNVNDEVTDVV